MGATPLRLEKGPVCVCVGGEFSLLSPLFHSPTITDSTVHSPLIPKDNMTKTIFDLPEILLSIAIHLAPADLAQACRVSRGWFVPFASKLWYSIQQDQWTDGNLLPALPRYAVFVRELRCPLYLPSNSLGHRFNQLTLFSAPKIDPDNLDVIEQVLKHNPDIRDLFLPFALSREYADRIKDITQTVAGMTKLKRLKLRGLLTAPGDLGSLLDQLPELESLTLEDCGYAHPPGMEPDPADIPEDPVTQLEHSQQAQQLRSLQMDGNLDCFEIILEIARRSPLLEQLWFVFMTTYELVMSPKMAWFTQKLGSHCQHLNQLVIHGCEINGEGLECLLSAFPRLRKFHAIDVSMRHYDVLDFLVQHKSCCDSLEEVSVGRVTQYLEGSLGMTGTVRELLQGFPRLRKVHLRQCRIAASEFVLYRTRDKYFVASKDLEVLAITLSGPGKSWVPAEVHSEDGHAYWGSRTDDDEDEKPDYSLYNEVMEEIRLQPKLDPSTIQFY
ncbi:MAG: hypothetical protein J3Q66DRAFT_424668 [Benniella sp.]|nr:MAG: hypothetical protein J3Q66DRAFT_424668 [Benniella sp.]